MIYYADEPRYEMIPGWFMLSDWPMGTIMWFLFAACLAAVALFVVTGLCQAVDRMRGRTVWRNAKVVEKQFVPESDSTGTGVGANGSGGVAVVVTSSHEDAKFVLLVEEDDEEDLQPIEVSSREYRHAKPGDRIRISYTKGKSGTFYGPTGYELPPVREVRP